MTFTAPTITVGWLIALLCLLIAIVLVIVSMIPLVVGLLIAGVALARLL